MMTTSSEKSRLHRIRNLASISLVTAAAAGAICSGTGTGTAATSIAATGTDTAVIPTHTTDTTNTTSRDTFHWSVTNHTGKSIYGTWKAVGQKGDSSDSSHVESSVDNQWKPDASADAYQRKSVLSGPEWTGNICYNEHWWKFKGIGEIFGFSLEADSKGTLHAIYYDSDIFGDHKRVVPFARMGACQTEPDVQSEG
ncbi:hypothetical protein R3Q06_33595 [Rhodococcus erythropolis]|uniref:hypothetical protein n=1 Tax=Rhodococcus erythropolis TaxID=1833 RepID=UPI002948FBD5|nr:hypothetical protein [Rhodococcus erythropolis]MDV6278368.1 hypothetical protein [Rhodococcus erythropolis]